MKDLDKVVRDLNNKIYSKLNEKKKNFEECRKIIRDRRFI